MIDSSSDVLSKNTTLDHDIYGVENNRREYALKWLEKLKYSPKDNTKISSFPSDDTETFIYGRNDFLEYYCVLPTFESLFKAVRETQELEEEIFARIVLDFGKIEKVKSVYVQKYLDELQIYIPLTIEYYDSDLMKTLLYKEYNIRKKHADIVFEFFYPPVGTSDKGAFIHPLASCIYSR